MTTLSQRRGFTLIELIMVMAIMVVLASMTLAAAKALGVGSKKTKTQTILAAVRKGIELTIANKGGAVSPVEHPFAGSKAPRLNFRGTRVRTLDVTFTNVTGGSPTAIATAGEAFRGAQDWFLSANQTQCLMPDDWMADQTIPMFYGMKREYMTILGAQMSWVTEFRRLPRPTPPITAANQYVLTPYAASLYPDTLYLTKILNPSTGLVYVNPANNATDNKMALDYLFGSSNVLSELSALKALYSPPETPVNQLNDTNYWIKSVTGAASAALGNGLVWSKERVGATGEAKWAPGRVKDNDLAVAGKYWKTYRLRGLAIYDAWEREILCSISTAGAIRMMSAGEDGAFVWNPGLNWSLQTGQDATTPAGDDKDGSKDNVLQETAE